MKVLIIVVALVLVLAALGYYAFLSGRRLWRSVREATSTGANAGARLAEPFSTYPPLPADLPLASPFVEERRVAAWQDLRRVHRTRRALRNARLSRATNRWQAIDPRDDAFAHLDRRAARQSWELRRQARNASATSDAQR